MHLRVTWAKQKSGVAEYVQLVQSVRNPDTGIPQAQVIHHFGRRDQLDLNALRRLIKSIGRFLDDDAAVVTGVVDTQDIFVLNLQRAIQAAIDLAVHIVTDEDWGLPLVVAIDRCRTFRRGSPVRDPVPTLLRPRPSRLHGRTGRSALLTRTSPSGEESILAQGVLVSLNPRYYAVDELRALLARLARGEPELESVAASHRGRPRQRRKLG